MKDEKSKITAVAIEKMIDFYQGNLRDIEHFLKVWAYAKTIGEQESVDENTQGILVRFAVKNMETQMVKIRNLKVNRW